MLQLKIKLRLNSSLMMSLGAGGLKVSRGPNAISREEVSMATLEAGTTPRAATNQQFPVGCPIGHILK